MLPLPGLREGWSLLRSQLSWPSRKQLWQNIGLLLVTAVITLTIWSFVIAQTNPTERETFDNVSLTRRAIRPTGWR
jgi:hypothetical protein